ncbi:hypothetical protein [Halegenticoccus soli]|uniref:hypothetical protein n=1 Tax=Halegenticoccus soli TaxID=1985678 RepID=UPI0018ED9F33|nr:hypothetical protein [Halegenticoccus soli]
MRDANVDANRTKGGRRPSEGSGDAERSETADGETAFEPDPERVRFLREIADDVRSDSSESRQVAAILYRVSDLYDESGDTSPEEIYLNVRNIMRIKERGGRER